jgi:cell division protein FtsQ
MSARVARGSQKRSTGKRKSKRQPGMLDSLPMPAEAVRKVSLTILLGMLLAVGVAVAAALRVPQMIGTAAGEAVGSVGFAVKRVEIKGLDRMNPMQVHYVAASQNSMAMPLVELNETRDRLLRFGWVEEARVYRRWPDTLVVDIVERKPAAIWQYNQQLNLIDREGVVLEPVKLDQMPDLPIVIGPAANRHAGELSRVLAAAPELKPMLAGAAWIGGRRWDLRFQSGEVLALPEGGETAQKALVTFARMDRQTQLLGRGLVRFDMRVPGKFIVRVSRTPGGSVPDLAPPPPPASAGPIDPATTI